MQATVRPVAYCVPCRGVIVLRRRANSPHDFAEQSECETGRTIRLDDLRSPVVGDRFTPCCRSLFIHSIVIGLAMSLLVDETRSD